MMEGLDGIQTCRAIKQRKYASGGPPLVVMLTSRGGSIDRCCGAGTRRELVRANRVVICTAAAFAGLTNPRAGG